MYVPRPVGSAAAADAAALPACRTGGPEPDWPGLAPGKQATSSLDIGKLAGLIGSLLGSVAGLATNFVFLIALLLFLSVESREWLNAWPRSARIGRRSWRR